jgi:quinol monooxygenase YgiN
MNPLSDFVSLQPYFKVHPGKLEAFKAAFPAFVEKTATKEKNLFYAFTAKGDEIFCREAYTDAEGVLTHLENIGAMLAQALKIADLIRVEVHGPATELDKLKGLSRISIQRGSRSGWNESRSEGNQPADNRFRAAAIATARRIKRSGPARCAGVGCQGYRR